MIFYRQPADIDASLGDLKNEGLDRNNIADTLHRLKQYDEARPEIMRAIECDRQFGHAAEPWKTLSILHDIEVVAGDHGAARAAYRQQGGYAKRGNGKLVEQVLGLISQQKEDEIEPLFKQLANDPKVTDSRKQLIQAVVTILDGSRDPVLADDPALYFADAAEILFLIERLEK